MAVLTIRDAGLLEHGFEGLVCFSKRWTLCGVPPPTCQRDVVNK